ncbi:hypothetical protein [Yinghuangia soli]|uniref:Uncharacterized protein n=1 Tax=Yinghuangia soli TaxID=2908204 RepID=A0AA41PX10_9ACTN|nr:hypothetical protein [Yinghuangia soli]MCF2526761.1 hypothetical protein [Yinghuangia soli]
MGEDAGRAREFEEPAFPQGPRAAAEPPLSVGTWTEFGGAPEADADPDRDSDDVADLGPGQMVEAAVPRARGARRVLPGDDDRDHREDGDEDEEQETTVRLRAPRRPETIPGKAEPARVEAEPARGEAFEAVTAAEAVVVAKAAEVAPEEPAAPAESDEPDEPEHAPEAGPEAGHEHEYDYEPEHAHEYDYEPEPAPAYAAAAHDYDEAPLYIPGQVVGSRAAFAAQPAGAATMASPSMSTTTATTAAAALDLESAYQPPPREIELRRGRHSASEQREPEFAAFESLTGSELRPTRGPFEVAVLLGAPAVALTALLYYFGWARSAAMADFLGYDEQVLGFTTKEYLLRSVDTLYRPMLAVVGILLAARMLHPHLLVRLRRHRRAASRMSWVLRCAWFAVPVGTWTVACRWPGNWVLWWPLLLPAAMTVGVAVSAYGVLISRQVGTHRRATGMGVRPWSLSVVLTAAAVVLCLFWTLGAYAKADGQAAGLRTVAGLPSRTAVVVYSANDLRVAADQGITMEQLAGKDSTYRFRYSGLRLLRRAEGRLFLLPDRWSWDRPRLVVVREDAGIRVEYLRAR